MIDPARRPRAIVIARPCLRRDLASDWRRWSPAERAGAMLFMALATAACLLRVLAG